MYSHVSLYTDYRDIAQLFPDEHKQSHGAVFTSFAFIDYMFSMFDKEVFSRADYTWCDMGCGLGYFSIVLYFKLMDGLEKVFPEREVRSQHILCNMLHMIDIQPAYEMCLRSLFGDSCHIVIGDVMEWTPSTKFDVIVGNPPFHCNHIKQVPTNREVKQLFARSETIWPKFVLRGISMLKENGFMNMVVPSLWCKYDSYGVYDAIASRLVKLRLYNNTESNKLFHYQAQTPCSIFLFQNTHTSANNVPTFHVYDSMVADYVPFSLVVPKQTIPTESQALCSRMFQFAQRFGSLSPFCLRTIMPSKRVTLTEVPGDDQRFENIHSCVLDKSSGENLPKLVYKYSNIPCVFQNRPKLVLAHKMYGFPFYDVEGKYGISNRDNYVIYGKTHAEFLLLQSFTSSILFIYLLDCFKYRMKMIEPCIISYIPDVTTMSLEWNASFTTEQNDEFWYQTFACSPSEKEYIRLHFSKQYGRIPVG